MAFFVPLNQGIEKEEQKNVRVDIFPDAARRFPFGTPKSHGEAMAFFVPLNQGIEKKEKKNILLQTSK